VTSGKTWFGQAPLAPLSIIATLFNNTAFNITAFNITALKNAPAIITALYIVDNGFPTPPLVTDTLAAGVWRLAV
jgi:hypothetical protein